MGTSRLKSFPDNNLYKTRLIGTRKHEIGTFGNNCQARKIMGLLTKIRKQNPQVDVKHPSSAFVRNFPNPASPEQSNQPVEHAAKSTTLAETEPQLPPPIVCLICGCPAIWSSVYDPAEFRCCDCDPPPGGNLAWHWQRGGWAFIARRLWMVLWEDGKFHWEPLPRADYSQPPGGDL